jgi:hypothetical protein
MSSELEKYKACLSAVKILTKTFEEVDKHNIKVRSDTATALENWKSEKAVYEAYLSRWDAKSDEFSVWNKFDGKSQDFWASAYDSTCWWGRNDQSGDQWCKEVGDRKGLDGGNYRAVEWRDCQGRKNGDFKCAKPDDIQRNQQQDYQKLKPVFNKPEPKFSDFGGLREYPQNNTISCCSNSVVVSGNTEFKTIDQSCENELKSKITKSTVPSPVTSPTALDNDTSNLSPPLRETPISEFKQYSQDDNDNSFVIFLVLILLIFSSSISLAVSGFLFLG